MDVQQNSLPILELRIKHRKLTRVEARKAKREYEYFIKEVEPIEVDFCNDLFDEALKCNYHILYSNYLLKLNHLIEWLNDKKFKIILVDSHFFEKNYKPLENIS